MSSISKNKKTTEIQKNSRANHSNSIEYNEDKNKPDYVNAMKKGYLEMAQLNLKIAIEGDFYDIGNYETWLSGVWFVKWRLW